MNTLTPTRPATGLIGLTAGFITHLRAVFFQRRMRRQTIYSLQALDDHLLKDIGLLRPQIYAEAERGSAEARRLRLW